MSTDTADALRKQVRERYAEAARAVTDGGTAAAATPAPRTSVRPSTPRISAASFPMRPRSRRWAAAIRPRSPSWARARSCSTSAPAGGST